MGVLISDTTKFFYLTGLRNAHAMETQAINLLSRQAAQLENYPELAEQLRKHHDESIKQRERLDEVLSSLDEKPSVFKEVVLGIGGQMAAASHMAASDEVIKDTLANYMFEHFEIAAYESLGVMAEVAGHAAGVAAAEASHKEEEAMAAWLHERIKPITRSFLTRAAAGETASH